MNLKLFQFGARIWMGTESAKILFASAKRWFSTCDQKWQFLQFLLIFAELSRNCPHNHIKSKLVYEFIAAHFTSKAQSSFIGWLKTNMKIWNIFPLSLTPVYKHITLHWRLHYNGLCNEPWWKLGKFLSTHYISVLPSNLSSSDMRLKRKRSRFLCKSN